MTYKDEQEQGKSSEHVRFENKMHDKERMVHIMLLNSTVFQASNGCSWTTSFYTFQVTIQVINNCKCNFPELI